MGPRWDEAAGPQPSHRLGEVASDARLRHRSFLLDLELGAGAGAASGSVSMAPIPIIITIAIDYDTYQPAQPGQSHSVGKRLSLA